MPLEEASLSREPDGAINEDYCKWCYADGKFAYASMDKLIDFCAEHMASEQWPAGQVRAYLAKMCIRDRSKRTKCARPCAV